MLASGELRLLMTGEWYGDVVFRNIKDADPHLYERIQQHNPPLIEANETRALEMVAESGATMAVVSLLSEDFRIQIHKQLCNYRIIRLNQAMYFGFYFRPGLNLTLGGWGFPDLPRLHSGGTVKPPTGHQEALIVARRGERVFTPGERGAPGSGAPSHVAVFIGPHQIVDAIVEYDRNVQPILPQLQPVPT